MFVRTIDKPSLQGYLTKARRGGFNVIPLPSGYRVEDPSQGEPILTLMALKFHRFYVVRFNPDYYDEAFQTMVHRKDQDIAN